MSTINLKTPLTAIAPAYFDDQSPPLREASRQHYYRSLRNFADALGRDPILSDLSDENVSLLIHRTLDRGLSPATANQRAKQLLALWRWAADCGLIETRPTLLKLPEVRTVPPAFTAEDIARLTRASQAARGWIGPHRAATWWQALHGLLLDSGERIGAVFMIKRDWVNADVTQVDIPGEARKSGEDRTIQIAEHLRPLVRELMEASTGDGFLFQRSFEDKQSLYKRYRRLLEAAGIEPVKQWGFRRLVAASSKGGAT